jgi:hypothetical protein
MTLTSEGNSLASALTRSLTAVTVSSALAPGASLMPMPEAGLPFHCAEKA